MTRKAFSRLRFYANIGFDVVSAALTINFMISIPKKIFEKFFYFIFGGSIEAAKLYLAALVKDNFSQAVRMQRGWAQAGKVFTASLLFVVYLGTASFSAVMSTGYVLYTVKQQSETVRTEVVQDTFRESQIQQRLGEIAKEISITQDQMARNPDGYSISNQRFAGVINDLQEERGKLSLEFQSLIDAKKGTSTKTEEKIASDTIFSELGKLTKPALDGQATLLRIMLILTILLEVFIFITMGKPEDDENLVIPENPNLLKKYIASMFEGSGPGKRLRSDFIISRETGIPIKECERYRELISGLAWKGVPLLVKTKTSTSSKFTQESIEKIVFFNLDLGRNK